MRRRPLTLFTRGIAFLFILTTILVNFSTPIDARAQVSNGILWLDSGESIVVPLSQFNTNDGAALNIGVKHNQGIPLDGFTLHARMRPNYQPYCEITLRVRIPNSLELDVWDTSEYSMSGSWSDWVSLPISHSGGATMADVSVTPSSDCYFSFDIDVEIYLEGAQPDYSTPTRTPTRRSVTTTPTRYMPPSLQVQFWSDAEAVWRGDCTWLHWRLDNASQVYLDGASKNAYDDLQVCPSVTTTYVLEMVDLNGQWYEERVTVYVSVPSTGTPTRTITPLPKVKVDFWSDADAIWAGDCTTLHWQVENAEAVNLDNTSVDNPGMQEVCPAVTTTYRLQVWDQAGNFEEQQVTVYVSPRLTATMTVTPAPPPIPPEPKCPATIMGGNYVLLVTDSSRLDASLKQPGAWERQVKPLLEKLYLDQAEGCMGKPYFLDLAEVYGSSYFWTYVKPAIQDFALQERDGLLPSAVGIIGGPDVVPMAELANGADDEILYTDDVHVDFDIDPLHVPDVMITRLPDGGSLDLLRNFITRFNSQAAPPGSAVVGSLVDAIEETILKYNTSMTFRLLFAKQAEPFAYLMAPIWGANGYDLATAQRLFRLLDASNDWSSNPPERNPLNVENLVINLGGGGFNSSWWSADPVTGKPIESFTVNTVRSIPGDGGWHVFSLAGYGGNLEVGEQTPENSIPLQFLYRGAHHYIGPTTNNYFAYEGCRNLASDGFAKPVCHMSLTSNVGKLLQYYLRYRGSDPGALFYLAKRKLGADLAAYNPYDYKALHSFVYYGLPEPGKYLGALVSVGYYSNEELVARDTSLCPSAIPGDCDGDEISEKEENWLVNTFVPKYYLAKEEMSNRRAFIYQVSPVRELPSTGQPGVVMTIAALYDQDYVIWNPEFWAGVVAPVGMIPTGIVTSFIGEHGVKDFFHYGDNEALEFWFTRQPYAYNTSLPKAQAAIYGAEGLDVLYVLDKIVAHRHHDAHEYDPDDFHWLGTHPEVYVSEGKHATFSSPGECLMSVPKMMIPDFKLYNGCDIGGGFGAILDVFECAWDNTGGLIWDEVKAIGSALEGVFQTLTWHEHCSDAAESSMAGQAYLPFIADNFNVGEIKYKLIDDMDKHPYLSNLFRNESVWVDERFCGGYRTNIGDFDPEAPASIPVLGEFEELIGASLLGEKICGGANLGKWCGAGTGYCAGDPGPPP